MTKKIVKRKAARPRPDMYSKKKKGYVSTSVRVTVEEVKLIRDAAEIKGESQNFWMTRVLLAQARRELAAAAKETN